MHPHIFFQCLFVCIHDDIIFLIERCTKHGLKVWTDCVLITSLDNMLNQFKWLLMSCWLLGAKEIFRPVLAMFTFSGKHPDQVCSEAIANRIWYSCCNPSAHHQSRSSHVGMLSMSFHRMQRVMDCSWIWAPTFSRACVKCTNRSLTKDLVFSHTFLGSCSFFHQIFLESWCN